MALMCSRGPERIAGGTVDTGNAKIAAHILARNGGFAVGASVTLCPSGYLPALGPDSADHRLRFVKETATDDSGYFRIDTIDTGAYRIEINDGKGSAVLLDVALDTALVVIDTVLRPYASVKGNAGALSNASLKRFIIAYGLDRRVAVDDSGSFSMDLPAGDFRFRIATEREDVAPVELDGIGVRPEDTVAFPFAGWSHRARISLNTAESGAAVGSDVYGFPVLVRLSKSNFQFGEAAGNGCDCRFAKTDGSPLACEIEQWDSMRSLAAIWVRTDTVYGDNSIQGFDMFWGNPRVAARSDGAVVFDTSLGFMGNYHFGGNLDDATINRYNGLDNNTVDVEGGLVGRGRGFNGSSHYVQVDNLPDRPSGAISCWFRPSAPLNGALQTTQGIWGKKTSDSLDFTLSIRGSVFYPGPGGTGSGAAGNIIAKYENPDSGYYLASKTSSFSAGTWYYVAWSWAPDESHLFVNGSEEISDSHGIAVSGQASDEIGRSFYDGSNIVGGGPLYFSGALDEFRMDCRLRSPDWIKLCYMNQRQDDKLVLIGSR